MVGRIIEKVCNQIWHRYIEKLEFGLLPKEYNAKIHGPYSPARYYGKPDVKFMALKMSEIPAWLRRRDMGPVTFVRLLARKYWGWHMQYRIPRYTSPAGIYQAMFWLMFLFYWARLHDWWYHKSYRYHW